MAVLDDLERVKQQVARRLQELEPLVTEYNELQQVADRLGISPAGGQAPRRPGRRSRGQAATGTRAAPAAGGAKTTRASARRSGTRRTARGRRNAASPRSRQQDVLRLVGERPGITVPELGSELGVDPTGLYQIVRRLEGRGDDPQGGPPAAAGRYKRSGRGRSGRVRHAACLVCSSAGSASPRRRRLG